MRGLWGRLGWTALFIGLAACRPESSAPPPTPAFAELPDGFPNELYPGPGIDQQTILPQAVYIDGEPLREVEPPYTVVPGEAIDIDFGRLLGGQLELRGAGNVILRFSESAKWWANGDSAGFHIANEPQTMELGARWRAAPLLRGGLRYVRIESASRAQLAGIRLRYTPRRIDIASLPGGFRSTEPILDRAWYVGLHTLLLNTIRPEDGFVDGRDDLGAGEWLIVDGAKRDRLVWTGDLAVAAPAMWATLGEREALRDSLDALLAGQRADGALPAVTAPSDGSLDHAEYVFLTYTLWWLTVYGMDAQWNGADEWTAERWQAALRAYEYGRAQLDATGLPVTDASNGVHWSFTLRRQGANAWTAMVWIEALERMRQTAILLGESSEPFENDLERARAAVLEKFLDEPRGMLRDSESIDRIPQDANTLALLHGLIEPERVLPYLRNQYWVAWGSTNVDRPYDQTVTTEPRHNKLVYPFINYFETRARLRAGDGAGALELMLRCWGWMLESDPQTGFWEWIGPDGEPHYALTSLAHAWSTGIVPLLSLDAVGFSVEKSRVVLSPSNLPLPRYRVRIPWREPLTVDVAVSEGWQRLIVTEGPGEVWLRQPDLDNQDVWLDGERVGDKPELGPLTPPFEALFRHQPLDMIQPKH